MHNYIHTDAVTEGTEAQPRLIKGWIVTGWEIMVGMGICCVDLGHENWKSEMESMESRMDI